MRNLTKFIGLALLYIMLSLLINFGWKLLAGESVNIGAGGSFWLISATLVLLVLYTWIMCRLWGWMYWKEDVFKGHINVVLYFALYLIVVAMPVVGLHLLLLQVVMESHKLNLMQSRYWETDFLFFLTPVLAYATLIYFYPTYRLFKGKQDEERKLTDLEKWEYGRNTAFLRKHLMNKYPSKPSFVNNLAVMLLYVVFLETVERYTVAYLITGEKLLVDLDKDTLKEWEVGNWLVKISETVQLNMLHVEWPIKHTRELRLDEQVWFEFRSKGIKLEKLKELIKVARRMEVNVKEFIAQNNKMGDEGWDREIVLLNN